MEKIISKNPATQQAIHETTSFDPAKVAQVVSLARKAQQAAWAPLSFKQRADHLWKAHAYMFKNSDDIARAISLNNGKPLVESFSAEVMPMINTVKWACENAPRILRDSPISIGMMLPTKKAYVAYEPIGVLGIISPWNYPLSTPLAEIFLGLIAGNAIVLKPSDVTGLVNEHIQKIVDSMGLPQGLFTMIEGRGDVGAALAAAKVDRIVVTGSVATGRKVMAAASNNLTPVTLELGGKDSMIICDDANIDVASSAAVVGCCFNAGQTCCSVERLLVHENIAEPFMKAVKDKIAKLRQGETKGFDNDLGPITFDGQKKVYAHQVADLKQQGGQALIGEADYKDGNFMKPLVVKASDKIEFWNEETFGPVMAYRTFKSDEEAIEINNSSVFGLTAMIFSKNNARAKAMARKLHVGSVVINDAPFTNAVSALPWGGVGDSGFGRVHGEEGLKELCHARLITYDIGGQQKQFWWYPYSRAQYDFFKSYVQLFSGRGFFFRLSGLVGLIKNLIKMGPRL